MKLVLPVLIVQHTRHEHPAAIRRALESQGVETLWLHPYKGESYPAVTEISGMISLGGPMGANDHEEHPWITQECALLRSCVEAGLPTVGICLGGQMLAKALGAAVKKNSTAEVGWFPIELNAAGKADPVIGAAGETPLVYHWHHDTFDLPGSAERLAHSSACPNQAFRIGQNAYGFQFHPEADHQLVHEWLDLEGVQEEITDTQKIYGDKTVQSADQQRTEAAKGERASLQITASLCQLFRKSDYVAVDSSVRDRYKEWAKQKTALLMEFKGPHNKKHSVSGHISKILNLPKGEFLIFRSSDSLLWPVRMDNVFQIKLVKQVLK